MKIKDIKIKIKTMDEMLDETAKVMKKLQKEEKVKSGKETLNFSSIDEFRRFFTNKRLELLKTINKKEPNKVLTNHTLWTPLFTYSGLGELYFLPG